MKIKTPVLASHLSVIALLVATCGGSNDSRNAPGSATSPPAVQTSSGTAVSAVRLLAATMILTPPETSSNPQQIALGQDIYFQRCWFCHSDDAASGGITPDLRHSNAETHSMWDAIVLGGSMQQNGMPGFGGILAKEESDAGQAYVIARARLGYRRQQSAAN